MLKFAVKTCSFFDGAMMFAARRRRLKVSKDQTDHGFRALSALCVPRLGKQMFSKCRSAGALVRVAVAPEIHQ